MGKKYKHVVSTIINKAIYPIIRNDFYNFFKNINYIPRIIKFGFGINFVHRVSEKGQRC